jgi:microsomal dipeptidase-like Zn-dependent dipeptidase
MPFFDFHCHPGLKPTFSDQAIAPSVWKFISAKLAVFQNVELSINPLFNEVLNSQSCLSQLFNGDVKLFGLALHSPEAAMAEGLLQKKLVNKGAVPLLNHKRLELVRDGKHYFEFMKAELARLQNTPAPRSLQGAKLKIIKNSTDFDEGDKTTIYGFLIVEGLHCFFDDQFAPNARQVFEKNFEQFTNDNTVIAINPCHIQMAGFCNHAYGIQFIANRSFFPTGSGITNWGKEIINRMLEKKILTDVKHMSLWSRWQLYSMLRDPADQNKFIAPILCTHAGLTGVSINDRVKYLLKKPLDIGDVYEVAYLKPKSPYIKETYFNCSSINLYNEDIEAILLSDGLIGLSFDQRILGFSDENVLRDVTTPNDVEYISEQEANFFFGPNPRALPVWKDDSKVWTARDFENLEPALNPVLHPLFFMNQVVHILTVAKNNPNIGLQKALKKICIGSDYDGLINAIDNCKQVDKLDGFKQLMLSKMKGVLKNANLGNEAIDVPQFINDLFYNNGKDFIITRLKSMGK